MRCKSCCSYGNLFAFASSEICIKPKYNIASLRKTSPQKKHRSKSFSSQDVKQVVSSQCFVEPSVFLCPHDVTFDSLLVVDSIQDGPCSDEVLEAFEHAHYPDCHVSLL